MKTENDLPVDDGAPASSGLFTDQPSGSGLGYDGAPAPEAPPIEPEQVETKKGDKLFRVKLENGHAYVGKTKDEVFEQLYKAQNNAAKTITEREAENRELRAKLDAASRPAAPAAPAAEAYDPQKYFDIMGKDPIAAQDYLDSHNPRIRELQQKVAAVDRMQEKQQVTEAGMAFLTRNPDYVPTQENLNAINSVLNANRLKGDNLVNLEWAFSEAKRNGLVTAAPADATYEDINFQQQPRSRRPSGVPPIPRGSGSGNGNAGVADFSSMSLEQMREHLRKSGAYQG